jgi:protein tyrosine phosphatase (PTP) superfamily phosphohydrolase (DUF442 family)
MRHRSLFVAVGLPLTLAGAIAVLACTEEARSDRTTEQGSSSDATPMSAGASTASPVVGPVAAVAPLSGEGTSEKKHESPLHNYRRLSERMISGASPETDADFAYLAAEGVKTIVSVDGARPDVEAAARHGLRYVHVPIGYDGIPREKQVVLAKAFRELPGPFYVHCHHGKHRGPAACMIGRMALDGITPEQAVAEMKDRGTDPRYRGLYAVPTTFREPTPEELAAAPSEFPAAVVVSGMTEAMVHVDATWERLKAVRKTSWKTPADHPNVEPAHEATILAEHFRELARTDDVARRDEAFRRHLKASEDAAWELSAALRAGALDAKKAAEAFDSIASSCAKCHTAYRDNR